MFGTNRVVNAGRGRAEIHSVAQPVPVQGDSTVRATLVHRSVSETQHARRAPAARPLLPDDEELRNPFTFTSDQLAEPVFTGRDSPAVLDRVCLEHTLHELATHLAADVPAGVGDLLGASGRDAALIVIKLDVRREQPAERGRIALVARCEEDTDSTSTATFTASGLPAGPALGVQTRGNRGRRSQRRVESWSITGLRGSRCLRRLRSSEARCARDDVIARCRS